MFTNSISWLNSQQKTPNMLLAIFMHRVQHNLGRLHKTILNITKRMTILAKLYLHGILNYDLNEIPTRIDHFLDRHVLFMSHESNNGENSNASIQACTKTDKVDHNCISATTTQKNVTNYKHTENDQMP